MGYPNFNYENKLYKMGQKIVAGLDEVGCGSFAGPVVAGTVVFRSSSNFQTPVINEKGKEIKINDSKKLTDGQRRLADKWIRKNCLAWGIGVSSVAEINCNGLSKSTCSAFRRSVVDANRSTLARIQYLLIDAFYIPYVRGYPRGYNTRIRGHSYSKALVSSQGLRRSKGRMGLRGRQFAIIKGDEKSFSIAAASIVAKVYRDDLMISLSKQSKYMKYMWEKNKGYGTLEHKDAIRKCGITKHHRKGFMGKLKINN